MTLKSGVGFESDILWIRQGIAGDESDGLLQWIDAMCKKVLNPALVTIAINTTYPELQSGYYINRNIFAVILEGLSSLGLRLTMPDNYRSDGLVAIETSFGDEEEYFLIDECQILQGAVKSWESLGGRTFYHDKTIVNIIATQSVIAVFEKQFAAKCKMLNINVHEQENKETDEHQSAKKVNSVFRFFGKK